jgi:DNA-binding NtrC family response regulator
MRNRVKQTALGYLIMEKTVRILILEDRASDDDLMEFELQEAGIAFTSKWVKNEREYLQALRDFSPDLILSDYDLPQYTGSLALAEAKRLHPEVPFIIVTGAFDEDGDKISEFLAMGANDCVFKSRLDRLASSVRRALYDAKRN